MPKGNWQEFQAFEATTNDAATTANALRQNHQIKISRIKSGKKGKTVTLITGLDLNSQQSINLLKELKTKIGTGGTYKDGSLELQGDHVNSAFNYLTEKGWKPKKSGG